MNYDIWLASVENEEEKAELKAIDGNEEELEDRFYCNLSFGTAGMRGVMGMGTNRMNRYMVRRVTFALAEWLKSKNLADRGVAIAGDTRNGSRELSLEAALTLATAGVKAFLYPGPSSTPLLSYTVRSLNCGAGIVVTASHNTREYNGYKVYDSTGNQMVSADADEVAALAEQANPFAPVISKEEAEAKGLLTLLGREKEEEYCREVMESAYDLAEAAKSDLKIVYTPLHGTGIFPVPFTLKTMGYKVNMVPEQSQEDGDFPTVRKPNPEEKDALVMGIRLGEELKADIVLGTDPDCDRVGIAVRDEDDNFRLLNGNQTGALLVNYLVERRGEKPGTKSALIKSVVTNDLGAAIARKAGVHVEEVLTGFKYVGKVMTAYEESGEYDFMMGYEESYGYVMGNHVRDKDAVVASLLICEMAAYYKSRGFSLWKILTGIYHRFGTYLDGIDNIVYPGSKGKETMSSIMDTLRAKGNVFPGEAVEVRDYINGFGGLPPANVLKYVFADGSMTAVRPSGTEPKLKIYYSAVGHTLREAQAKMVHLSDIMTEETKA